MDLGVAPEIANLIDLYNDEPPMMLGSADLKPDRLAWRALWIGFRGGSPNSHTNLKLNLPPAPASAEVAGGPFWPALHVRAGRFFGRITSFNNFWGKTFVQINY